MSNLSIGRRMIGDIAVIDLEGRITIGETNRQLHEELRSLVTDGTNQIILNLMKVKGVDSSGLGELVAGYSTLKAHGGDLVIINMPTKVMELMTLTKLYTLFDVYQTEAEAISALGESRRTNQSLDNGFPTKAKAGSSIH
jgi:anti-sigma B factor antagonist